MRPLLAALTLVVVCSQIVFAQLDEYPAPGNSGSPAQVGRAVQRTMELLASSRPDRRNTVRILLYGQSITAGAWGARLGDHLHSKYPYANMIFERRPLSGFSTERLVKTAEADLYPFYPDLVIFHDYGNNDDYERMIRRLRAQTTSEVIIQADHLRRSEAILDESQPASIADPKQRTAATRNYRFLPQIAEKYGCGFDDRRDLWKDYLREHDVQPGQLVRDDVHPNDHGTYLMTELIKAYLIRREDVEIDPMNCGFVTTHDIETVRSATTSQLRFDFEGNRIDVVFTDSAFDDCRALIDGQRPLSDAKMFYHGRNRVKWRDTEIPPGPWPAVLQMSFEEPLIEESWALRAKQVSNKTEIYEFSVTGSVTGEDGTGRTDQRFVSDSGRVVIDPENWDINFAIVVLRRLAESPAAFQLDWKVETQATDIAVPPVDGPGIERVVTIAQRLTDAKHTLELSGGIDGIKALRVYAPSKFLEASR